MTNIIAEFKKFALKGNVVDLAVGVIIGAAFGKIVTSLVDHIIMPPLGMLAGGINFSNFKIVLAGAREGQPEVAVAYGLFLQNLVNFVIIAWALFVIIRLINRLHHEEKAITPTPEDIVLLREIRDSLKK